MAFSILPTDSPDRKIVEIDSGTNELISDSIKRAQRTPEQLAQEANAGVSETAGSLGPSATLEAQRDQRMGYSGNAMNKAISNQYGRMASRDVGRIKDAQSATSQMQKSAELQRAAAHAMARQNVQIQSYQKLMEAYNAAETARAQVLSSILGAGGSVAGAALANKSAAKAPQPAPSPTGYGAAGGSYNNYGNMA